MFAREFDVVIAGAGPAGSLAAFILSRAGKSVALLDRAIFPRAKVCGDCLNPNCWSIWKRYGLADRFSQLPHQAIAGFSLELKGSPVFRKAFPLAERSVQRATLDAWLCAEAQEQGAIFFPGTTVIAADCSGLVTTSEGTRLSYRDSITKVTGPSFVSETAICAWNTPVSTRTPLSRAFPTK